ncbi:MAG: hypothetical protein AB7U82_05770 [Blastocatellales bacterium]
MANNYTLFSEVIRRLNEEERVWCENRLRHLEQVLPNFDENSLDEDGEHCAPEDEPYLNGAGDLGFQWKLTSESNEHELWMYAEESCDLEHVALFVREFLARFRPNEYFTLTWAETCSKPRISEFSGGAVFVTAEDIEWHGATAWICRKVAEFAQQGKFVESPYVADQN